MRLAIRVAIHILVFLVALAIFYFGLGVGLLFLPWLGTLLWMLAGAVAVANIVWMLRRPPWRQKNDSKPNMETGR